MKDKELHQLLLDDVARSGIPTKLVSKLGFEVLTPKETRAFLGRKDKVPATSYRIPFFDHRGKPISFSRLRLLKGRWFSAYSKGKGRKPFKYNQREGTAPHLYFPNVVKWQTNKEGRIKLDYLCVTEGEKKAIKACLCGIPTVALSGVFNFQSRKRGISLIDDFKLFDLSDGVLEICYDSDLHTNEQVLFAMNAFAAEAMALQPKAIRFVMLEGEERVGLDDFLTGFASDKEARKAFYELPRKEDARVNALAAFDAQLRFVETFGQFYNIDTRRFYKGRQQLVDHYENLPEVQDPSDPRKMTAPIKLWFTKRSPQTTVRDITYIPDKPAEYSTPQGPMLNVWRKPLSKPIAGKPTLWLELVEYLFKSVSEEQRTWFLQWLAYPIQHPGAKLLTAVFLYTHVQGVGKNFVVDPFISGIYGDNFVRVDGSVIESEFNAWAAKRQFIFIDEARLTQRNERTAIMNTLNSLITNKTFAVNEKFQPRIEYANYGNVYIASNYSDALALSDTDRRFFVVRAPEAPLERAFYDELDEWGRRGKGVGQVFNYLMELDLTGFNPNEGAPKTESREEVIQHSSDTVTHFVRVLKQDPDSIFIHDGKLPERELFTATELLTLFNEYANAVGMPKLVISPDSLGRYLVNMNVTRAKDLKMRYRDTVLTVTLYAAFNPKQWHTRQRAEWIRHYKNHDERFASEVANVVELEAERRKREA
jgi:hypothetical protein